MNLLSQTLVYFFFVLFVSSDKTSSHLPLNEIIQIPDPEDNILMSLIKNRNGRRMCTYKEYMHDMGGSTEDLHIAIRMYRDDGRKDSGRMNSLNFKSKRNDILIQTHPLPLPSFQQGAYRDGTAMHNPDKNLCIYTTHRVSLDYIEPFVKDMIATRTPTNIFGILDENKQNFNLNDHQKKVFRYYKSKLALPPDFDYYIYAWVTDKPCSEFGLGEPRYEFVPGQSSPVISRTAFKEKK